MAKERFNSDNPNFLGIDFEKCTETGLTEALKPYIGIIEPFIFKKPEHKLIQTSFWTDADEVIETCRWIANQQEDGIFPPESWLRKRDKYSHRQGESFATLGVYIQRYVGGMENLRRILGESSKRYLKWTRESVLSALEEWMIEYEDSPSAYYQRKKKMGVWDENCEYARSIYRGVRKHVGTLNTAMEILGYSQKKKRWVKVGKKITD